MSAFKQFTTKDVIQTPFIADKGWDLSGSSEITGSQYGLNIYYGRNYNISNSGYNISSGFVYTSSLGNIYNSAKHLYYTNFLTQSTGDNATTQSVTPGATREDDYFFGPIVAPRFENYLQSTLEQKRFFPTASNSTITTLAIPQKLFGEGIVPYTFRFEYTTSNATFPTGLLIEDDGEGNLISSSITSSGGDLNTDLVVGQIFYNQGTAVFTTGSNNGSPLAGIGKYSSGPDLENMRFQFSSSITIYEQQYKCTILENEFGYSTNPSLLKNNGSSGSYNVEYYDYVTSSFFEPYVTCVGLYNENTELVAVGKLSFPLPISQFTDTTIIVNYDV